MGGHHYNVFFLYLESYYECCIGNQMRWRMRIRLGAQCRFRQRPILPISLQATHKHTHKTSNCFFAKCERVVWTNIFTLFTRFEALQLRAYTIIIFWSSICGSISWKKECIRDRESLFRNSLQIMTKLFLACNHLSYLFTSSTKKIA